MKHRILAGLLAFVVMGPAWAQGELTGTPYTVLYRGRPPGAMPAQPAYRPNPYLRSPVEQPQFRGGTLRLIDAGTRREIARSEFDDRLGGYMFQLPFDSGEGRTQRCLALVDGRGQYIALRSQAGRDTGVMFRNPAWEAELGRVAELASLKTERAAVDTQTRAAAKEIGLLQAEVGLPANASPADCPLPPPAPEPPRPPAAIDARDAGAASGAACALRWERDHGGRVNLGRMFSDAGAAPDWQQRAQGAELLERLPDLRIPIAGQDLALVLDAATKGRTYLEHGDGVRLFNRAHAACREEVGRLAAAARQAWERAVVDAREAPQRARQQCAQKLARIAQLQATQANAPAYLAALDKRIAQRSEPPPTTDAESLGGQTCQP